MSVSDLCLILHFACGPSPVKISDNLFSRLSSWQRSKLELFCSCFMPWKYVSKSHSAVTAASNGKCFPVAVCSVPCCCSPVSCPHCVRARWHRCPHSDRAGGAPSGSSSGKASGSPPCSASSLFHFSFHVKKCLLGMAELPERGCLHRIYFFFGWRGKEWREVHCHPGARRMLIPPELRFPGSLWSLSHCYCVPHFCCVPALPSHIPCASSAHKAQLDLPELPTGPLTCPATKTS